MGKKKERRDQKFSLLPDSPQFASYMYQKFYFSFVSDFLYLCYIHLKTIWVICSLQIFILCVKTRKL